MLVELKILVPYEVMLKVCQLLPDILKAYDIHLISLSIKEAEE